MAYKNSILNWLQTVFPITKTEEQRQDEERKKIYAAEEKLFIENLRKVGIIDLMELVEPSECHVEAIFSLLKFIEGRTTSALKEGFYRILSCANWLKGEQLIRVLDILFNHFENDHMLFIDCSPKGALERLQNSIGLQGVQSMHEVFTIDTRQMIGSAIKELISPKLKSHKKNTNNDSKHY